MHGHGSYSYSYIFHWIRHDVISGSRSCSALEYWFSNTFTAFCFLWLFWYWWPAGRVYISRGFKGPRETAPSKPNIFAGLLFTRVWREIQAFNLGKLQGESKLAFMITCFYEAWKTVLRWSISQPDSFQGGLSWPAVAENCISGDANSCRRLFRSVEICQGSGDSKGTFNEQLLLISVQNSC